MEQVITCNVPNFRWGSIHFRGHRYIITPQEEHILKQLKQVPQYRSVDISGDMPEYSDPITLTDEDGNQINTTYKTRIDYLQAEDPTFGETTMSDAELTAYEEEKQAYFDAQTVAGHGWSQEVYPSLDSESDLYYDNYLKDDLRAYCRHIGIDFSGSSTKKEITETIHTYWTSRRMT